MDLKNVPHVHNEPGVRQIRVRAGEFMCMGALPPEDHPHIYIEMGEKGEAICPYCATHFVRDESLPNFCEPIACLYAMAGDEGAPTQLGTDRGEAIDTSATHDHCGQPGKTGFVASFKTERALQTALRQLKEQGIAGVRTYSPAVMDGFETQSPAARVVLIAGASGFIIGFTAEVYANVIGYPLDIGGRPKFSWPAFIPIAFEIGVLLAVLTGVVSCFIFAGLFRLYDPIDDLHSMRRAMRDRWVIAVHNADAQQLERAQEILRLTESEPVEEMRA